jgi:methionyl-tRNA synthetase
MTKTFYVTTPIYYVNDLPHLGHAYTTVAADVLARFKKLQGFQVFFLTGTDEHGQKVEKAARERDQSPQALADEVVVRFKRLWEKLNISYTDFIRTTEPRHKAAAQRLISKVRDEGDIYLDDYQDWYCTPCETFLTETNLVNGNCPDCGRPVEKLKEKSYFFRLSSYQDRLRDHIQANPGFIQPESRRREVLSFIAQGLRDLSVSRTSFGWGIPVPWDESHVIYVWFDALTNYLTAVGYAQDAGKFKEYWPASVHIIGKDILRFHAIYWPSFLLSANIPLPKKIAAHGWWTVEGQKMSKSLGNVVDPEELVDKYGVDALRYFLLRQVPFGQDGDFSHQAMLNRANRDLANDLGNLCHRVIAMVERYFQGSLPPPQADEEQDQRLMRSWQQSLTEFEAEMEELNYSRALTSLWQFVTACNKYLDQEAPWILAKKDPNGPRLPTVLYHACDAVRLISLALYPFMPDSCAKVWKQLGIQQEPGNANLEEASRWRGLKPGLEVKKGPAIFPRYEE